MGGKISCAYDMFRVGSRIDDVVRHGFLVVYWSVYVSNSVLQYLCKIMKPYLCPQCAGFFFAHENQAAFLRSSAVIVRSYSEGILRIYSKDESESACAFQECWCSISELPCLSIKH